jgi:hypothetical protein
VALDLTVESAACSEEVAAGACRTCTAARLEPQRFDSRFDEVASRVEAVIFRELLVPHHKPSPSGPVLGTPVEDGAAEVVRFGAHGKGEKDGRKLQLHHDEVQQGLQKGRK